MQQLRPWSGAKSRRDHVAAPPSRLPQQPRITPRNKQALVFAASRAKQAAQQAEALASQQVAEIADGRWIQSETFLPSRSRRSRRRLSSRSFRGSYSSLLEHAHLASQRKACQYRFQQWLTMVIASNLRWSNQVEAAAVCRERAGHLREVTAVRGSICSSRRGLLSTFSYILY
jgi:hypothetical protein